MPVNLTKGGNVSLTKEAPGLAKIAFGLGWNPRTTDGTAFDLDAIAVVVKADSKVVSDKHFVFYNNLKTPEEAVVHTGDNRTGEGDGDDEVINVDLGLLPAEAQKIVFAVNIHDGPARGQNFGQVSDAYIRAVDAATGTEIMRYDLSEDASTQTTLLFGELYRKDAEWKFRALGDGYADGLEGLTRDFGV